jgi:hypothetical protein
MPILAGQDSSLVMLTLFLAKGSTKSAMAPGLFLVATTMEVLSFPLIPISCFDKTRNLVEFRLSSSIF